MIRKSRALLVAVVAFALCGADAPTGTKVEPTNDLPNPYRSIAPWGICRTDASGAR
jgi:hypothetical protein